MSVFIIGLTDQALPALSPQEGGDLYPSTIIVFVWTADDKSRRAAG